MPTKHFVLFCCSLLLVSECAGQTFDERFDDWPLKTTVSGTLVIGVNVDDLAPLAPLLAGSSDEKKVSLLLDDRSNFEPPESAEVYDSKADSRGDWIRQQLKESDCLIWMAASDQDINLVNDVANDVRSFLNRGGSLALIGPHGAAAASKYLNESNSDQEWQIGLNLIPDCILNVASKESAESPSMMEALWKTPRHFGIELHEGTLLVLKGRKFRVINDGVAVFQLAECEWLSGRRQVLRKQSGRERPYHYLVDLTEWRRGAIDRTLEQFPSKSPRTPHVENGTLFIVGGGGMPDGLMEQFIEAAGGKENARLVYVPCSEQAEVSSRQRTVEAWKQRGVKHATFIHTKDRAKANTDAAFYAPLKDATGIWFGGGRQWNFADSYYGTETHRLMKDVLRRGGVVGGSSAGASIQGRYLARATPIENFRIMAPGYERGGLGFLSGVAIDQHFSQRGRQKDMTQLVNRYPQLLGIGIDEATALIVTGSTGTVVGKGSVFFYDRKTQATGDAPDYLALPAGSKFDLADRRILHHAN